MSASLHTFAESRISEAFGPPQSTLGKDIHWAIRPAIPNPLAINVLMNGSAETPIVWVFDPHDRSGETVRTTLQSEADVESMVTQIQHRVNRAAQPS